MNLPLIAILDTAVAIAALGCLFGEALIPVPKDDGRLAGVLLASSGTLAVAGLFLSAALVAHGFGLIA